MNLNQPHPIQQEHTAVTNQREPATVADGTEREWHKLKKKLENRKEVKSMNFLCKAQAYLNSVVSTVSSLAGIAMSNELCDNIDAQYKVIRMVMEWEQTTAEFITVMELDAELPQSVKISKQKFANINERLIKHLEKIQLQGYNMEQIITTLKLENTTLKEEIHFL